MISFTYFSDSKMDNLYKDRISKDLSFSAKFAPVKSAEIGMGINLRDSKYQNIKKYIEESEERCSDDARKEFVSFNAPAKMHISDDSGVVYWHGEYYPHTKKNIKCVFYLSGSALNCIGYTGKKIEKPISGSTTMKVDTTPGTNMTEKTISIIKECNAENNSSVTRQYHFVATVYEPVVFVPKTEYATFEYQDIIDYSADELRIFVGSPLYVIPVNECKVGPIGPTIQIGEVNGKRKLITTEGGINSLFPNYIMTDYQGRWISELKDALLNPFICAQFYEAIPEIERRVDGIASDGVMSKDHKYEKIIEIFRSYYYVPAE